MNPLATVAAIHAARTAAIYIVAARRVTSRAEVAWEFWLDDESQSGAEYVAFRTAAEQALIRAAFVEAFDAEMVKAARCTGGCGLSVAECIAPNACDVDDVVRG